MLKAGLEGVESVLCLGAHADDIEIGCGGCLLELLARKPGIQVTWVVLSSTEVRREEARRSAAAWLETAAESTLVLKEFPDSFFPAAGRELKEYFLGYHRKD